MSLLVHVYMKALRRFLRLRLNPVVSDDTIMILISESLSLQASGGLMNGPVRKSMKRTQHGVFAFITLKSL